MKQTPAIIPTVQKNSLLCLLCCALLCTVERFLLAAAMIIRRICDPNRSSSSIMFVAADAARGDVSTCTESFWLCSHFGNSKAMLCVQVRVLCRARVCMPLALFCANLVTPAILCSVGWMVFLGLCRSHFGWCPTCK